MKKIPFNKFNSFYLNNKEIVLDIADTILSSGKYIRGIETTKLEKQLCDLTNRKYTLLTSSCTDALFLSLKALNIKKGDEIIIPVFSYIASLSPILMCGATPVFVDINPSDLMLDIDLIKDKITSNTKAIIFVQLFGNIVNLNDLIEYTKEKQIAIIEDNAQGIGSKIDNIPSGSFGDFSCISFDPTKVISAFGTGGAILTNNTKHYSKLKKLIHHGRNDAGDFEILGYNSKISELNVALINEQLKSLNENISKVTTIANKYFQNLQNIKQIEVIYPHKNVSSNFHKFVIRVQKRNELQEFLNSKNIETKIHYKCILNEHKLLNNNDNKNASYPIANKIKDEVLSLPIYPELSFDEIDYICENIIKFY